MDEAVRLGMENRETIELARRHCLKMEFIQSGGQGYLEAATGLPINMRQVRCPVAIGNMAMNLGWIASDFVRANCAGCLERKSTGEVPNLATVVAQEDAAAEEAALTRDEALEIARKSRADRVEARKASIATGDLTMAGAFEDLDKLDITPGVEVDRDAVRASLDRLNALADKAPETFSEEFVAQAAKLVVEGHADALALEPLRRLAIVRPEFAPATVEASLTELRWGPSVPAGRCVADLASHISASAIDDDVCRATVMLAGEVSRHGFGAARRAHDPSALRALADLVPEQLARVLNQMLSVRNTPSAIILLAPPPAPDPEDTFRASAAAGAARALAPTHPDLASTLTQALVRQLTAHQEYRFTDDEAIPASEHALAVYLVLGVGDVMDSIAKAGEMFRGNVGERCVRILSLAADLAFQQPGRREPGDPIPGEERAAELVAILFSKATATIAGVWGDDARTPAAELVKTIASNRPDWTYEHLSILLGIFLNLEEQSTRSPNITLEALAAPPNPQMQAVEQFAREGQFGYAIGGILEAVELLAKTSPAEVCASLVALIDDERENERGFDVAWHLLRLLGNIGERHGGEPRVLQSLLPTLHTYIVGADGSLQVEAIDAWTRIGRVHPLSDTLADLLPALTADSRIGIARAVARAAIRLEWTPEQNGVLLIAALRLLNGVNAVDQHEAVEEAVRALKKLSRRLDVAALPERVEQTILEAIDPLRGYALRNVLDRTGDWAPGTRSSARMARLRLRLAADPQINNRWNARDDVELCTLLDTGAGLTTLPAIDLERAALDLAPDQPLASAEFAEVAWRAGRPDDAAKLLGSVLAATPNQPSHNDHREILLAIAAAVAVDVAVVNGEGWEQSSTNAIAIINALAARQGFDDLAGAAASVNASAAVRRALQAAGTVRGADPATQLETQAVALEEAGSTLAAASQQATATGRYLRHVAAACEIGAHLVRTEAAVLNADSSSRDAHAAAAKRRAKLLGADIEAEFTPEDPLAGPLLRHLETVDEHAPDAETAEFLKTWATLLLPVPLVTGPRRRVRPSTGKADGNPDSGTTVAVVLASIDDRLVTGPLVLRKDRVYELTVRVQTDEWPEWADTLDLEVFSHLTPTEITIPAFTWTKDEHADNPQTFEQSGSLALRFALAAGQPGIPLMTQLTWRGTEDGQHVSRRLDVSGHRQLRVRPYDETRDRATNYAVFDERLLALYDTLTTAGYDDNQLQAFCRLFTAICRAGLAMTWDKKYRRGTYVKERTFHDDLHNLLLADPELGGRVERGAPLGLGYLDTRHDGITAELKVERQVSVTRDSAPKYLGQPTQYAAADGARLSILAILDMSPKTLPIGTPENYMFTLEPRLHGLTNPEAPSLTVVLIINGNMPIPSSWSRKKTPIVDDAQIS